MKNVQVVILAAGKGSRLSPLTDKSHKSLVNFASKPLLIHTLEALFSFGFIDIKIITGHMREMLEEEVARAFSNKINFIFNPMHTQDINSYSLYLGLCETNKSVLVIEADVVVSRECWPIIHDVCQQNRSTWFTYGYFKHYQAGGIIKSDASNKIIDMQIVKSYQSSLQNYSKNLGIVLISSKELPIYKTVLEKAALTQQTDYYMQYWIDNLYSLACYEKNLYPNRAGSFNTYKELQICQELVPLF